MIKGYYKQSIFYLFILMLLIFGVLSSASANMPLLKIKQSINGIRDFRKDQLSSCGSGKIISYWGDEEPNCFAEESGTIFWNGFHHKWENTPHRLNKLGSYFRNIEYYGDEDEPGGDLYGELRSIFKVGEYNDQGTVKIKGQFVKTSVLGLHQGYVNENCLTLKGNLGEASSVTCRRKVDIEKVGLLDYDKISVVLRGFKLEETSYESGYNTRGFTIRVDPIGITDDGYFEFDVIFEMHAEHAPDRPLPSWFPLGDTCGDCDTYTYSARIYYTIVGVNDRDGNIIDAASKGTNSYSQYVKMSPNKTPSMAGEKTMTTSIRGLKDYDHGIIGIQGIKWHLEDWDKTKKDGRYIRELRFNIANREYDPESGEAWFETKMYFSNSGLLPEGFDVSFTMWNALIQFNDDQYAASNPKWYKGYLEKGDTDYTEEVNYSF